MNYSAVQTMKVSAQPLHLARKRSGSILTTPEPARAFFEDPHGHTAT